MNVAIRCRNPPELKGTNRQGKNTIFKPLFLWTYSFQEAISGTKEPVVPQVGPTLPMNTQGRVVHQAPWCYKGMFHHKWRCPSRGRQGQAVPPPPQPSCPLTFLWVLSLGGFTCGLGPSCLCYWEWFPPGAHVSPSPFCLNRMDKPSGHKSPVLITPFLYICIFHFSGYYCDPWVSHTGLVLCHKAFLHSDPSTLPNWELRCSWTLNTFLPLVPNSQACHLVAREDTLGVALPFEKHTQDQGDVKSSKETYEKDLAAKIQASNKCLLKIWHLSKLFSGWRR